MNKICIARTQVGIDSKARKSEIFCQLRICANGRNGKEPRFIVASSICGFWYRSLGHWKIQGYYFRTCKCLQFDFSLDFLFSFKRKQCFLTWPCPFPYMVWTLVEFSTLLSVLLDFGMWASSLCHNFMVKFYLFFYKFSHLEYNCPISRICGLGIQCNSPDFP